MAAPGDQGGVDRRGRRRGWATICARPAHRAHRPARAGAREPARAMCSRRACERRARLAERRRSSAGTAALARGRCRATARARCTRGAAAADARRARSRSTRAARRARMHCSRPRPASPALAMESPRGINDPCARRVRRDARAGRLRAAARQARSTSRSASAAARRSTPTARFVQIDPEPAELDRARRAVRRRLADRAAWPTPPRDRRAGRGAPRDAGARAVARRGARARSRYRPAGVGRRASAAPRAPASGRGAARRCSALLDRDPDAVLVCDGGEFGQWVQACLERADRVINGVAGSIGAALPFALAARARRARRAPSSP